MQATQPVPRIPANGARIPAIGLGTSRLRGADCARAVETALSVGYRHIDTAVMYGNEDEVGQGMKAAGVIVYTVGFDLGNMQLPINTLKSCATSPSHFYETSTGEQLRQAFRDIALKISTLRIAS